MPLKMNNLTMPDGFPTELFDKIFESVYGRFKDHPCYFHFQGAWNAVAFRYLGMVEYDARFTESVTKNGPGPANPERYNQERDLFGFASSAYSMFDALHYAMYAVGLFYGSNHFSLSNAKEERKVNFTSTEAAYKRAFVGDPIMQYFSTVSADIERADLDSLRNMLTHRASPPRAFRLSVGGPHGAARPSAEVTRLGITIDKDTTAARAQSASRLLSDGLNALENFLRRH